MSKDLTEALRRLTEEASAAAKPVEPMKNRAAAGAAKSAALNNNGKPASGGGIASPLVEASYAARTWHTEKVLVSTDGILAFRIKPVKTVDFLDANGDPVQIEFKSPP